MKTFLSILLITGSAFGGTIVQNQGIFDLTIEAWDPIGQSFVAEEVQLSAIAFAFSDNSPSSPNTPITMTLYLGSGFGGLVIDSVTKTLPAVLPGTADPPQFIDFDFSGNNLVVGATYTAAVTTPGNPASPKVSVVYNENDAYSGGQAFESLATANISGMPGLDLNFRVTSVPEPTTWALLGLSQPALLGFRRRR